MNRSRSGSLWRNRDFAAFWVGETVSQIGTQVTFVALPLVAVLTLDATVGQLGLLRLVEFLPFLVFTLPFGVLADRRRRRPLMLTSYAIRGLSVALVPLLAVLGVLQLWTLAIIAFVVGVGAALFEVCWLSYVPSVVDKERLTEAMGKVATSHAAAEVIGPGIGGLLVQVITAPYALALDALSYLVGALALTRIRHREPEPIRSADGSRRVIAELVEGLRFAFGESHIRATALSAATGNFFAVITETVFLVYAIHELHFSPAIIGLVLTAVGAGGLIGAALTNAITVRWPIGRVYVGARIVGGLAAMLLPLAAGPSVLVVAMCVASFFFVQAALANTNVLNASLRQALTADRVRGRMNASVRTLVYGSIPLGALTTAFFGSGLGLHSTLWLAAIGNAASIAPILASPIPRLAKFPTNG